MNNISLHFNFFAKEVSKFQIKECSSYLYDILKLVYL